MRRAASGGAGSPTVASWWPEGGGKWLEISKYSSKKEGLCRVVERQRE